MYGNEIYFCNKIFEKEFLGYRFIDDNIVLIFNEVEVFIVEDVIFIIGRFSVLKGVNLYL